MLIIFTIKQDYVLISTCNAEDKQNFCTSIFLLIFSYFTDKFVVGVEEFADLVPNKQKKKVQKNFNFLYMYLKYTKKKNFTDCQGESFMTGNLKYA